MAQRKKRKEDEEINDELEAPVFIRYKQHWNADNYNKSETRRKTSRIESER